MKDFLNLKFFNPLMTSFNGHVRWTSNTAWKYDMCTLIIFWYTFLCYILIMMLACDNTHFNKPRWTKLIGCFMQFSIRGPCIYDHHSCSEFEMAFCMLKVMSQGVINILHDFSSPNDNYGNYFAAWLLDRQIHIKSSNFYDEFCSYFHCAIFWILPLCFYLCLAVKKFLLLKFLTWLWG